MGGILTRGLLAANSATQDLLGSLFNDFMFGPQSPADIVKAINDPRWIDVEVMQEGLLAPIYTDLLQMILDDTLNKLAACTYTIILFMCGFAVLFLISGCGGWRSLVRAMNRAIYDTNVIVASLPPDIILRNPAIVQHLGKTNETY